jgi:hypothetical protein
MVFLPTAAKLNGREIGEAVILPLNGKDTQRMRTKSIFILAIAVVVLLASGGLPALISQAGRGRLRHHNADPHASNAKIMVEVKGAGTSQFGGLALESPGNVVRGLAL